MARNTGEQADLRPMVPMSAQPGTGHMGLADTAMTQANQSAARAFGMSWRAFHFPDPTDAPYKDTTTVDSDIIFEMDGDDYALPWFVSPGAKSIEVHYIVAAPPLATTKLEVRVTVQTCITSITAFDSVRNMAANGTVPPRGPWRRLDKEEVRLYSGRVVIREDEFTVPADRLVCIVPKFHFSTVSGTNPSTVSTKRWCAVYSMLIKDRAVRFTSF